MLEHFVAILVSTVFTEDFLEMVIFWTCFSHQFTSLCWCSCRIWPLLLCHSAKDLFADSHGGLAPIPQAVPPLDTGTSCYLSLWSVSWNCWNILLLVSTFETLLLSPRFFHPIHWLGSTLDVKVLPSCRKRSAPRADVLTCAWTNPLKQHQALTALHKVQKPRSVDGHLQKPLETTR